MHVCRSVRMCVCACVRAYNERKLNPGSPDSKNSQHSIFILDTGETQDIVSFCRAGSLTRNSPNMFCEKKCAGARDEDIYELLRIRRLFAVNSRRIALARLKTPKKSYKTFENAFSDTLLMSGFQIGSNYRG